MCLPAGSRCEMWCGVQALKAGQEAMVRILNNLTISCDTEEIHLECDTGQLTQFLQVKGM